MMIKCVLLIVMFLAPGRVHAYWISPRPAHPLGVMHQLPAGETPGWRSSSWTDVEFSWSSVWGAPITILNRNNGRSLEYSVDFEQKTTVVEKGLAWNSWFATAFEFMYVDRSGGVFDRFIDDFHVSIDSDRFLRQEYPKNQNRFRITADGQSFLQQEAADGPANLKLKMKFWPARWRGENRNCPCGIGFSLQSKFPLGRAERGLTTGAVDVSGLLHVGVPVASESAFYITAGATRLGENRALEGWPRLPWILLLDAAADLGLTERFGVILQFQMNSPFIDQTPLEVTDPLRSDERYKEKRLSSAWNSLVLWRVYQSVALRYRFSNQAEWTLGFSEDIGINDYDEVDDYVYVNNAPDFMFTSQLRIPF